MKKRNIFIGLSIVVVIVIAVCLFYPVSEKHSSYNLTENAENKDQVSVNSGKPYLDSKFNSIEVDGVKYIPESVVYDLFRRTFYEQGYFYGQKHAIGGNYNIKLDDDGIYYWTNSVWVDDSPATYIPTKEDSE